MQWTNEKIREFLEDLEALIDFHLEERLNDAFPSWVMARGGVFQGDILRMALGPEWRVNWAARVRFPDGSEGWVLVSARAKAWLQTVQDFVREILRDPQARAALQAKGVGDPMWPVVFAMAAEDRALEAAMQAGVGLLLSRQGMVVAPMLWSLERGAPLEE